MVKVRVSDGHNEDLAFDIYVNPGLASAEYIADLFIAMSGLHQTLGGEGLTFKVLDAGSGGMQDGRSGSRVLSCLMILKNERRKKHNQIHRIYRVNWFHC